MRPDPHFETAFSAGVALLAEGVAVALFMAAIFVWLAIIGTTS